MKKIITVSLKYINTQMSQYIAGFIGNEPGVLVNNLSKKLYFRQFRDAYVCLYISLNMHKYSKEVV